MTKQPQKIQIKPELLEGIKELCNEYREILMVSVSTMDGFNIKSFAAKSINAEADKIAAMTSTLCALSNSSSSEILGEDFNITTVESNQGNMLFVSTEYLGYKCVLAVAAKSVMSLATARFTTKRLADLISNIEK